MSSAKKDLVAELSQSLKAAGVHPSQTAPVVLHERGDIFPHVELPKPLVYFVRAKPDLDRETLNAEIRALRTAAGLPPDIRTAGMVLHLAEK